MTVNVLFSIFDFELDDTAFTDFEMKHDFSTAAIEPEKYWRTSEGGCNRDMIEARVE